MPQFNAAGLALLCQVEGCKRKSYQDQAGVWTIGYGHTGPEVVEGLTWTQAQCDAQRDMDVRQFATEVAKLILQPLSDDEFSAQVIFAFNIGLHAYVGSSALHLINKGLLLQVPSAMELWNKITIRGKLVIDNGLTGRRHCEVSLWNSP
ncbi:MAG TPA: lysozyme [Stellaceae bacterium]|nr:lysozyme [Stellaceae bacterium]